MAEQEIFKTPTEALHDESRTKQNVAESRADEKKIVADGKGATNEGYAKNDDEEGEFLRFDKKLCMNCGDGQRNLKLLKKKAKPNLFLRVILRAPV